MHCFLTTTLFLLSFLSQATSFGNSNKPPSKNAILLSDVQTLTVHSGRQTSSRRVPSIPQLTCVGPSRICSLHTVDVMRCTNEGYEYDEEDIQWSCSASLPAEFKLGGTEVICEGYRDPDDKFVLKGSCGVEYRLLLTDVGEERFGRMESEHSAVTWFFCVFILAFIGLILLRICMGPTGDNRRRGGGWGGWGGGNPPYDPPPPYDSWGSSSGGFGSSRPGFWSGAALGGATGYGLGRRYGGTRSRNQDPWVGGSGSSRHQSTGFGSSRRR